MKREAISVFDMFKIGVGPSSSHTLGPWRAAQRFASVARDRGLLPKISKLQVLLYGSLAKTGKGHGTDIAVLLGLSGADPVTFDTAFIAAAIERIHQEKTLMLEGLNPIAFDPASDLVFLFTETLPYHPNALTFLLETTDGDSIAETYYSIGGGFIQQEGEIPGASASVQLPFPVDHAGDLLHWCMKTGMSISEVVMENENTWRSEAETRSGVWNIWNVMKDCIYRDVTPKGCYPGGCR